MKHVVIFILCLMMPLQSYAKNIVTGFRTHDNPAHSRFVLDLDAKPDYKSFTLENPPRAVIDINNTDWDDNLKPHSQTKRIKGVRYSPKSDPLRIVLDLNVPVYIMKSFVLEPKDGKSYRLVLDLKPIDVTAIDTSAPIPVSKSGKVLGEKITKNNYQIEKKRTSPKLPVKRPRKPLIVIDPGHGGHDPGAIGYRKTYEKDIALSYSYEIMRQLKETGKYDVYMTRASDIYLKLRERVDRARRKKGDMFISIHANAHRNRKISGFSVYTLSEIASDKEAAALARRENKEDIISGINLEKESDEITEVLIDMTQRDTKNVSASFAETIVSEVEGKVKLIRNPHRFAGFRVLKGADIPSVLVEVGYISNRKEEKLLKSKKHKKKLAKCLVRAIDRHFEKYKPE